MNKNEESLLLQGMNAVFIFLLMEGLRRRFQKNGELRAVFTKAVIAMALDLLILGITLFIFMSTRYTEWQFSYPVVLRVLLCLWLS